MQFGDIGRKGVRDDAVALFAHHLALQIEGEALRFLNVVAAHAPGELDDVRGIDVECCLREHGVDDLGERRKVRFFRVCEALLNDLALAAGAFEIVIHVAEAGVGHGLDAVKVLLPGLLQVVGRRVFRDASLQTRLRDVGIHVIKLGLRHVNVYTTEHVNGVCDGLPVEGDVVLDV